MLFKKFKKERALSSVTKREKVSSTYHLYHSDKSDVTRKHANPLAQALA